MTFWLLAIQPSTSHSPVEAAYSLRQTACTSCKFIQSFRIHVFLKSSGTDYGMFEWAKKLWPRFLLAPFLDESQDIAPMHQFTQQDLLLLKSSQVFCMGFGPRSADFSTATFVNGDRRSQPAELATYGTQFWEVIPGEQFTARKGEACECLRQVYCSGKQQRETQRCESLWLDDRHFSLRCSLATAL